jgi:hypothetical protein
MASIQDITKKFAITSLLMAVALTMFISTPAGAQDTGLAPITIETSRGSTALVKTAHGASFPRHPATSPVSRARAK